MQTFTEARHPGEFLLSEAEGRRSRDNGVIAINQTIVPGTVLGALAVVASLTAVAAADAGNTGNGVFTLDVTTPALAAAQEGKYRVVCAAVVANAGTFEVFDPAGVEIGRYQAGAAAFANQIKFTIADGATDFAVGDAFTVTVGVEMADKQYGALNLAAADGTQNAAAIALYGVTTDGTTTVAIALLTNDAEVIGAALTWPAGITAAQKAAAILQLRQLGIKVR